MPPTVG
jgi:2-oxoglutarate dehydrogenase E1 component